MTEIPEDLRETMESDPFCELLGIELVDVGPGRATTELAITDDLMNFHATPHGGALYSLADAAFAAASNADGETTVAMETNTSYLEAVDVGETVTAEAERLHRSGRTASYRVEVTDENDERIAIFRGRGYVLGE